MKVNIYHYGLLLSFLLSIASCSQLGMKSATQGDDLEEPISQEEMNALEAKEDGEDEIQGRVQGHLIDPNLPECLDCIVGSIGDKSIQTEGKKVYFLYGAEHLNLSNYYFDIPVVYNKATQKWINYFTGRGKKLFKRYATRAGRYAPVLSKILNDNGLPRDLIYLAMAESGFQNHARSWAKAVGPWQFMPRTGKKFDLHIDYFIDERRDPQKSAIAASKYLKSLFNMFGSWELAMASYNAGEGKIRRAIRRYHTKNFWKIRRGRYLKSETKNYVPKIMALAIIGKNLSSFGFTNLELDHPLDYEEIELKGSSDLYNIAKALDLRFEDLKKYNPELIRWQTPIQAEPYLLKIPVGYKKTWDNIQEKDDFIVQDYKPYRMRGHGTLKSVSRKFKIPVKVLEEVNGFSASKKLRPRMSVFLPFHKTHSSKHSLYKDLYERPRKSVLRKRAYQRIVRRGRKKGEKITNPKEYYTVVRGDSLWKISRKLGVNINTIIRSNYSLIRKRMILPGDKLIVR